VSEANSICHFHDMQGLRLTLVEGNNTDAGESQFAPPRQGWGWCSQLHRGRAEKSGLRALIGKKSRTVTVRICFGGGTMTIREVERVRARQLYEQYKGKTDYTKDNYTDPDGHKYPRSFVTCDQCYFRHSANSGHCIAFEDEGKDDSWRANKEQEVRRTIQRSIIYFAVSILFSYILSQKSYSNNF
jgi:hypothetical protein